MGIQLHTVGMVVRDMGASLAFYRLLGLPIPDGQDDEMHVELETGGYVIGFDAEAMVRQNDPNWQDGTADRIGLQFCMDMPADVDRTHGKLMEAGHRDYKAPWDAFWGQRFARVKDPDGNVVNFFADLPEAGGE